MRKAVSGAVAALVLAGCVAMPTPVNAYTVDGLVDGFNKTVFDTEYGSLPFASTYVRKFTGPVRVYVRTPRIRDKARGAQVKRFIRRIDKLIAGLDARVVARQQDANFIVHVVPRALYARTVRNDVYKRDSAAVRGRCMVRAVYTRTGISRSDAVIVTDEGRDLFSRCMTEEILQGLGPLNDDPTLSASMFNDTSPHTTFRRFDRLLLNMLYDRRLRAGATPAGSEDLLPKLARDALRRVGG